MQDSKGTRGGGSRDIDLSRIERVSLLLPRLTIPEFAMHDGPKSRLRHCESRIDTPVPTFLLDIRTLKVLRGSVSSLLRDGVFCIPSTAGLA
jgi:hypothetical protein